MSRPVMTAGWWAKNPTSRYTSWAVSRTRGRDRGPIAAVALTSPSRQTRPARARAVDWSGFSLQQPRVEPAVRPSRRGERRRSLTLAARGKCHSPEHDSREGGDPGDPRCPRGQRLGEKRHRGDDWDRVGAKCRDAGGGERAPALEAHLQEDRAGPVEGDHRGRDREVRAVRDRNLRRDVSGGEQD